jgi:hypothetical protein
VTQITHNSTEWRKIGGGYRARSGYLRKLGFRSYKEYLRSQLWAGIRKRVFEKKGRKCICCGEHATLVHHVEYTHSNLAGETLVGLEPLCQECHKSIEFGPRGGKRSARHAFTALCFKVSRALGPKSKYVCANCESSMQLLSSDVATVHCSGCNRAGTMRKLQPMKHHAQPPDRQARRATQREKKRRDKQKGRQ